MVDVEITPDGEYGSGNRDTWWNMKNNHPSAGTQYSATAQSFTTLDDGKQYKIKFVTFHMYKIGSPTGTGYAKIYAHAGDWGAGTSVPGATLATSDGFDVSTLTGAGTDYDIAFSGAEQITLSTNTHYVAGWENPDDGITTSNYVQIGIDVGGSHEGNFSSYRNSAWGIPGAADVATFGVYGEEVGGAGVTVKPGSAVAATVTTMLNSKMLFDFTKRVPKFVPRVVA